MYKKYTAIFLFLVASLVLFFQNCGKKFEIDPGNLSSNVSDSGGPLNPNPDDGNSAEAEFSFDVGGLSNLYQSESLDLSVQFLANSEITTLSVESVDGTAKADSEYVAINRTLSDSEITSKTFILPIKTLYKDVMIEDKQFDLVFHTKDLKHGDRQLNKRITIYSRYQPVIFQKIKSGVIGMCGLSVDQQTYCWGPKSRSEEVTGVATQPVKIQAAPGKTINFDSIQFSTTGEYCFEQIGSSAGYCSLDLSVDKQNVALKVGTIPSIPEGNKGWVYQAWLFYIDSNGYINRKMGTSIPASLMKTKKLVSFDVGASFVTSEIDQVFLLNNFDLTQLGSQLTLPFAMSEIKDAGFGFVVLNDGRIGKVSIYGAQVFKLYTLPEKIVRVIGRGCIESETRKIYCLDTSIYDSTFTKVYDLAVNQDKMLLADQLDKPSVGMATNACLLNKEGLLLCKGIESAKGRYGFNFVNSFFDPIPKSQAWIDTQLKDVAAYRPLEIPGTQCEVDTYNNFKCGTKKPFGYIKVSSPTLKSYSTDTDYAKFYDFIQGTDFDGRIFVSGSTGKPLDAWTQIYKRRNDVQNAFPGPRVGRCSADFIEQGSSCVLKNDVHVTIQNPDQLILFPNTIGEKQFTVRLSRPIDSDLVVNIGQVNRYCSTGYQLNDQCYSGLKTLCQTAGCLDTELNFETAADRYEMSNNRFNWDFQFLYKRFVIPAGQQQATISLRLSKDERGGNSKILELSLTSSIYDSKLIFDSPISLMFRRQMNPVPQSVTYSQLMANNGPLNQRCVACHNSQMKQGGLDLTDYEDLLVSRSNTDHSTYRLLAPGQDTLSAQSDGSSFKNPVSQIYRRVLPEFTSDTLLMPRNGALSPTDLNLFEQWLLAGGKNN